MKANPLARVAIAAAALLCSVDTFAATTVTVGTPTFKSGLGNQAATTLEDCLAKAKANAAANPPKKQRTENCVFPIVTVVTNTPPPPTPTDCVFTSEVTNGPWTPAVCPASGQQTRTVTTTRTVTSQPTNGGQACPDPLVTTVTASQACTYVPPTDPNPPDPNPPTAGAYTDIASGPACAKVLQYPGKTVVSAAAAGIPIHTQGACVEVFPTETVAQIKTKVTALKPGDDFCLHEGVYSGIYGEGSWYGSAQFETYKKGAQLLPISIRGCPDDVAAGKIVELKPTGSRPSIILGDGSRETSKAEWLTFANLKITARAACISGGGNTTDSSGGNSETGGRYIRVVGIDCVTTDATSNTMTGLLDFQNDGWQILASRFTDPANRVIINNNHGIYAQGGADDWRIAGNYIRIHGGAQIQVHQDGTPKLMERGVIEDNEISAAKPGDGRGISVINIDNASTITIRRNYVHDQGQGDWGCYQIYRGQVTIASERCERTQGAPVGLNGGYDGSRKVTISDSKLCSSTTSARIGAENGATLSQATETSPKACP